MTKKYQVRIDGEFVEITWQEGNDKKVLIIKPADVVKNYHAAQKEIEPTIIHQAPPAPWKPQE